MDFLQQVIVLLSEPPGSVIYHLITLFALQIVFAISYSRWRRNPDDVPAVRLIWTSSAIFVGRIALLIIGLLNSGDPQQIATLLPPLEQAVNTISIFFIVWALVPQTKDTSNVFNILLVSSLILTGILYLFSAQFWQNQISAGITYYNGTLQATIWSIIQIIALGAGLSYLLMKNRLQEALPVIIIVSLLIPVVANLFNLNEFFPSDTNVPYFVRLGYLIALPLLAVYAYQYTIIPLLSSEIAYLNSAQRYRTGLEEAGQIISTSQLQGRVAKSINMAVELLEANFVAIGLVDAQNPFHMQFVSYLPNSNVNDSKTWTINLNQQSAFNLALVQGNTIELLAEGLGARHLYDFYNAAEMDPSGPLLIHPLIAEKRRIGLLVAGASPYLKAWPQDKKVLMSGLAKFQGQAILNSQTSPTTRPVIPPSIEPRDASNTVPSAILLDQVRLHSLRAEIADLHRALEKSNLETKHAETRALAAQKQARYLAAALRAAQQNHVEQTSTGQVEADTVITRKPDKPTSPPVGNTES